MVLHFVCESSESILSVLHPFHLMRGTNPRFCLALILMSTVARKLEISS